MANFLAGQKVGILAADGVERVELQVPLDQVQQAGAQT
jgi:deglycase